MTIYGKRVSDETFHSTDDLHEQFAAAGGFSHLRRRIVGNIVG